MKSRAKTARKWILFWTLFIGIGALGGTAMMLFDPAGETTGMAGLIPFFQVLPLADRLFQNLIFSGIALLIVNGLTNLAAAADLSKKAKRAFPRRPFRHHADALDRHSVYHFPVQFHVYRLFLLRTFPSDRGIFGLDF